MTLNTLLILTCIALLTSTGFLYNQYSTYKAVTENQSTTIIEQQATIATLHEQYETLNTALLEREKAITELNARLSDSKTKLKKVVKNDKQSSTWASTVVPDGITVLLQNVDSAGAAADTGVTMPKDGSPSMARGD